jgi:DNA-binding NarL/FixJ family response regulator
MSILIADDCARMRREIALIVRDLASEIIEADNGAAAIAAWRLHKPDWITLDISMAPVDGLTAAREIRAADPLAKIVIVTAHDNAALRRAAQSFGVSNYVLKDDLLKIRDLLVPRSVS